LFDAIVKGNYPTVCCAKLCARRGDEMAEYAKAYISSLAAIHVSQIDHGPHFSMATTAEEAQRDALAEARRRWPEAEGWTHHHARVIEVRLDGMFADSMQLVEVARVEEDTDAAAEADEPPDEVPIM
jgi:hypothetical protein